MTKPSYVHLSKEAEELVVKPLESELARVRGLLQRDLCLCGHGIGSHTDGDGRVVINHCSLCVMDGCSVNGYRRVDDVDSGAESADIGKLDAADNKADV